MVKAKPLENLSKDELIAWINETLRGIVDALKQLSEGFEHLGNNQVDMFKAVTELTKSVNTMTSKITGEPLSKDSGIQLPNNKHNPFVS